MIERRLGRGLESLITNTNEARGQQVVAIPVDSVKPNPDQPRHTVSQPSLEGLSRSIRNLGVLQPIIVQRQVDGYQLVAGERRLQASKLAEMETIPALVVDASGLKSLEMALIENIQRENLTALEEAAAYEALLSRASLTHQELADRVGRSRAAVTNTLRLLDLPDGVKSLLHSGALSAGQARAILSVGSAEEMEALALAAARNRWSVREVERRASVRRERRGKGGRKRKASSPAETRKYEEQLRNIYGTRVSIKDTAGRGDLRFEFYSPADRDRLLHLLLGSKAAGDETGSTAEEGAA
jgi:ParB family chromosome partitioning protein